MTRLAPTVLLSAGDPSGDLHGAALARALRARWPGARLFGLGGPRMTQAGVEMLGDWQRLTVMGFAEVLGHLPYFWRLLRRLRRELVARRPDLVIAIDYPGLNLRLARSARAAGVPVLYYIAPQVWAWHRGRVRQLARDADLMAVVLPFEEEFLRAAGARAEFVGHPLLDLPPVTTSPPDFAARLGLAVEQPVLALFPGSRRQEIRRHLPLFIEATERLRARRPEVQPVVGAAASLDRSLYEGCPYPLTTETRELLQHARAALIKSGTSTLEAALAGVPMVIAYRVHPATFWLASRLVRVEHVGLANLIAGERVAPEFLQGQATPRALAEALLPLLDVQDPGRRTLLEGMARVRHALNPPPHSTGATVAERVVALAAELLDRAA